MAIPSDLTQTGTSLILALINAANPNLPNGALFEGNVTVGVPGANTGFGSSSRNSQVTISAIPGAGYLYSADIEYNRLNIQTDVADMILGHPMELVDANYLTVGDLLPAINAALRLNLQPADVNASDAIVAGNYPRSAVVTVVAAHLVLLGSLTVSITDPAATAPPPADDLATLVTVTDLDGLEPPMPA